MRSYIRLPFQGQPEVLGRVNQEIINKVVISAIPQDIRQDWHRRENLRIYSSFWADDGTLAASVIVKGGKDYVQRENLLSHLILSDEESFLINPVHSLYAFEESLRQGKDGSIPGVLQNVVEASRNLFVDKKTWEHWVQKISEYSDEFLFEALSAFTPDHPTYIIYHEENPEEFLRFVQLVNIVLRPLLGNKTSFVSSVQNFSGTDKEVLIRGYPIIQGDKLSEDQEKDAKEQDAAVVDLTTLDVPVGRKTNKSLKHIIDEFGRDPWVGLNRTEHIIAIHDFLGGDGKIRERSKYGQRLGKTVDRMKKLHEVKFNESKGQRCDWKHVKSFCKEILTDEEAWSSFTTFVDSFDEDFLVEALSVFSTEKPTYVVYQRSKAKEFEDFMRFVQLALYSHLGRKGIYTPEVDSFEGEEDKLIRGYPISESEFDFEKDDKKKAKKQKSSVIDLTKHKVYTKGKKNKKLKIIINEVTAEPWIGLDKEQHLKAMHDILSIRIKSRGRSSYEIDLGQTVDRLKQLEDVKI